MSEVLASFGTLLANPAPEGRRRVAYGVNTSVLSMANAVGLMLGGSVTH